MDWIDLPLIPVGSTVGEALKRLAESDKGAVVTATTKGLWLVFASDLGEVPEATPIARLHLVHRVELADSPGLPAGFSTRSDMTHPEEWQSRFTFDSQVSPDMVKIATQSESLNYIGTAAMICAGMPRHIFPEPPLRGRTTCPIDGTAVSKLR